MTSFFDMFNWRLQWYICKEMSQREVTIWIYSSVLSSVESPKIHVHLEHETQYLTLFGNSLFSKFKFNQPMYIISLVSDVEFIHSSVAYNTQSSSHHMPSLMPIPQLPLPPSTSPPEPSVCFLELRVSHSFSL